MSSFLVSNCPRSTGLQPKGISAQGNNMWCDIGFTRINNIPLNTDFYFALLEYRLFTSSTPPQLPPQLPRPVRTGEPDIGVEGVVI